jgi:AcrR family transcriptional regulator
MTRKYNSDGRKKTAEQTRNRILQAALKLHWEGITDYESLAQAADCSLPALRKHFPTKELLYRNCTQLFAETLVMPDLAALGNTLVLEQKLKRSISELCRIHEAMFGYAWLSTHQRNNSPTLDAEMQAYDGLTDAIAEIIVPKNHNKFSVIRGLLDFLTYRALRLPGALTFEEVCEELYAITSLLIMGHKANCQSITHP